MPKSELVDIAGRIVAETEKAILFSDTGDKKDKNTIWLPKSQIEVERDPAKLNFATVTLPEWLAKDKGLI